MVVRESLGAFGEPSPKTTSHLDAMTMVVKTLAEIWRRVARLDVVSTFVGIVAALASKRIFDFAGKKLSGHIAQRRWRQTNLAWNNYAALVTEFDVVQAGWSGRCFSEEDAVITVEKDFSIGAPFDAICAANSLEWGSKDFKNNIQIGINAVNPHHIYGDKTYLLLMQGHRFKYFEFLATNRLLSHSDIDSLEMQAAARIAGNPDPAKPVPEFANPVSVGLTLLCESGKCLALTRRSEKEASGGSWYAGLKFNAVGETVSPSDILAGILPGVSAVSPWNTARRALSEEIGFSTTDVQATEVVLHSMVFDRRIRDYKFFGYAITKLTRREVYDRWLYAPDKNEAKKLFFWDVMSDPGRRLVVQNIIDERHDWTAEAVFSTLWTFEYLGWSRPPDERSNRTNDPANPKPEADTWRLC